MNIKKWFKEHFDWDRFKLQITGFIILQLSFVLMIVAAQIAGRAMVKGNCIQEVFKSIIGLAQLSLFLAAVTGAIDIYIIRKAKRRDEKPVTITRWFRELLPKKIDTPLMIGYIVAIGFITGPLGWLVAGIYLHGFLNDHFNEDR